MEKSLTHRSLRQNSWHQRIVYAPDRVGIIGFHDEAFVIAIPAEAHQHWLLERSRKLHDHVGGRGTNIAAGLRLGIDMARRTPPGILRRIWLLSDGEPNREVEELMGVVQQAPEARVNINTVGFGDRYDRDLLTKIASMTHHGQFVSVVSLRELTDTLVRFDSANDHGPRHRSETTILVIDLSLSMKEPMEGKTKVQVVEEAVLHFLHYKQKLFS